MKIFQDLIKEITKKIKTPRIRISSIEPNLLTDEILNLIMNSKNIVPHFHIPLQSEVTKF